MQAGAAKALHTRDLKSGIDISDPALAEAWAKVRDDNDGDVTWALYGYAEGGSIKVALDATGQGLDALLQHLADDKVFFGGLRVGLNNNTTSKFLSFAWIGEDINGMKKGKASLHKNAILHGLMEGVAGELALPMGPIESLNKEELIIQAKKLTGVNGSEEVVM